MISRISVIDPGVESLEQKLPPGHAIDIVSPLVFLVGENGTGKSAFLRLLKTSIDNARYFDVHHISKLLRTYGPNKVPSPQLETLSYKGYEWEEIVTVLLLYKRIFPQLPFDPKEEGESFSDPYIKPNGEIVPAKSHRIKVGRYLEISQLVKEAACHDTPASRFSFLAFEPGNNYYPLCFASTDPMIRAPGIEYNLECVNDHFNLKLNVGERSRWGLYEREKSTGQKAMEKIIDNVYARVRIFFQDHRISSGRTVVNVLMGEESMERRERIHKNFKNLMDEFTEEIPEEQKDSAELIVFMDEPTLSLSYRNKYKFRDMIQEMAERYTPRLQFFIATNDPVLIERTQGQFLDFDKEPVESRCVF